MSRLQLCASPSVAAGRDHEEATLNLGRDRHQLVEMFPHSGNFSYLIAVAGTELSPFDEGFVSGVGFDPDSFGTADVWHCLRRSL